jgi:hypothetical protein
MDRDIRARRASSRQVCLLSTILITLDDADHVKAAPPDGLNGVSSDKAFDILAA